MATYYWTGLVDGDISKSGNYTPVGIPNIGDTVYFIDGSVSNPDSGSLAQCSVIIKMLVYGGNFRYCAVTLDDYDYGVISGGEYGNVTQNNGVINGGTFYGTIDSSDYISGGTFYGQVNANSMITEGTFHGKVVNEGEITYGTFTGEVINNYEITFGYFSGKISHNGDKIYGYFLGIPEITTFQGSKKFNLLQGINGTEVLGMP